MLQASPRTNASPWMATVSPLEAPTLRHDTSADVCVVGAGIAGMTTAYLLAREGKSVIVVDDGPIAGGQTQRTTAHLSNAIDDRYFEIERLHGANGARLVAESHSAAIDRIEAIVREERIECDFERLDGYLFVPPGESTEILDRELEAAHRAGLANVELLTKAPLDSFDTGPALRFPRQGVFHPLKYLAGLAQAIKHAGGTLSSGSHVGQVDGGSAAKIQVQNGPLITADVVVVATNTPINDLVAIHTKQAPYLSYAIGAPVPRGSVPKALYWDTLDPYHYVRTQPLSETSASSAALDILIVGGEDHKTGQADDADERYARLETWAKERFPTMREVRFRWCGQVMETIDGIAFIGRNPMDKENVYIATGDSGMGMTHGTIAGILLTDLILGRDNPWTGLYDPSRKTLRAAGQFISENLNVARQYADWLTPGDVSSTDQIAPGAGAVLRCGMKKVAAFRDEHGTLHECSATCPHLGCIVAWNQGDQTWDCPCHGSRFDPLGRVINGPANRDLPGLEPTHQTSSR